MTDKITALQEEIETLQERVETLEQHVTVDDNGIEPTFEVEIPYESEEQARPHPKQVIADACDEGSVCEQDARAALRDVGYDEPDDEIDRLRRMGEIYEPTSGRLKVV